MRIYRMTASFGKLNNATLALSPGLNILEAPNEWGKSTWCAFITAMLYGIDTKERTTKDGIAVKEKYQPWSGLPMEGSMDICWQGRDITIQRSRQGRIPFGAFAAFETATGIPVPELTAANCGKMLLGIDKGVYLRTGFLRLQELPVTDDGALRDRLNALVTTGDESGAEQLLLKKLKELKNACRYNKSGRLPEAEQAQAALARKLQAIDELLSRQELLKARLAQQKQQLRHLENHKRHLAYREAQTQAQLLANATAETARLEKALREAEESLAARPPAEETQYKLSRLAELQEKWALLQEKALPKAPERPVPPTVFAGLSGDEAVRRARGDLDSWDALNKPLPRTLLYAAIAFFVIGIAAVVIDPVFTAAGTALGTVFLSIHSRRRRLQKEKAEQAKAPYGDLAPAQWPGLAEEYRRAEERYVLTNKAYNDALLQLDREKAVLSAELGALTLGRPVSECMQLWNEGLRLQEDAAALRRDLTAARSHEKDLCAVIKPVPAPETEDPLTEDLPATERRIADITRQSEAAAEELQQLAGRRAELGDRDTVARSLEAVTQRIERLNMYYAALSVAMDCAVTASENLQRRFAPDISEAARTLFAALTDGKYDRVLLDPDFTLKVSAADETALRATGYRSDGTVDQLYFALRLAVAKALSPTAPLILDDALVRFDDKRLSAALQLLQQEAEQKQILLFTCQSREQKALNS